MLGVYSMGGDNLAILATFLALNLQPDLFVAHDLDYENRQLLHQIKLGLVLCHDMSADINLFFQYINVFYKLGPPLPKGGHS